MSTPLKVKRNQAWSIAEEKDFLLLCKEKAITDLLDKCVTSACVSRPFCYLRIINLNFKSKFKYTEDLEKTSCINGPVRVLFFLV